MGQFLNPWSGRQFLDASGDPYSGAKLFCHVSSATGTGGSTKQTLTKDAAGSSNHANPIILNARGEPGDGAGAAKAMWQPSGVYVKLTLALASDTDPPTSPIATWDNLAGINDTVAAGIDQWVSGPTPTYISATSLTLVGDQTTDFHIGRRLKTTNTAGTIYSTIITTAYTSLTTITVVNDSGVLDSGLSVVSYGLLTATNPSLSIEGFIPILGPNIASATALPWPAYGNYSHVTGTDAITSFDTSGELGTIFYREFDGILTLTHDATNLICLSGANITTAAGDVGTFIEYASGDVKMIDYSPISGKSVIDIDTNSTDSIGGLILSNDAGDTNKDINVTAGKAQDSDNTDILTLSSEITKRGDATWASGDDAGGISSSLTTIGASAWYHVFLVKIGGSVDVLFDTSIVCANGVTDHTVTDYRYIGSFLTDGSSNILQSIHYEMGGGAIETIWTTPIEDIDIADQSTTAVARTLSVPPDINPVAIFNLHYSDSDDANALLYVRNPDTTDQAPSLTAAPGATISALAANSDYVQGAFRIRTNTSSQVETRAIDSGGEVSIWTLGYEDARR